MAITVRRQSDRVARRRAKTRESLLAAAYALMSEHGVEDTSVRDVTDRADIGYGSFFNHFESKEALVLCLTDCLVNNLGLRNDLATSKIKDEHPEEVICTSMRLVIRELITSPIWNWLLKRPDLLVDRLRSGFRRFGRRDMDAAIRSGHFKLTSGQIEIAHKTLIWVLAGCAKDIADGISQKSNEAFYSELVMRAMGVNAEAVHKLTKKKLPHLPPIEIDFSFTL
jgi:AcrR family transcriptional regulator